MPGNVILGATGGVGSVLCERLAASGAQLVLGGRDQQRLEQLAPLGSVRVRATA